MRLTEPHVEIALTSTAIVVGEGAGALLVFSFFLGFFSFVRRGEAVSRVVILLISKTYSLSTL